MSKGGWNGLGGKFADSGAGMIAFGTVAGGTGAALTGGNFWQGAVTGLVVSGLNHYAHKTPTRNDPPNKYKRYFSNKLNEARASYNQNKVGLRQIFNTAEITGGTMEIAGSVGAIFTEGASLSIAAEGFKISAFGTAGNVIMDGIDGEWSSAFYRSAKFGVTFGMGKAIEFGVTYKSAQYFINGYKSFIETYIAPVIEDSWNKFTPRPNKPRN